MSGHPIEALLRPPVEAWSASIAATSAGVCLLAPWALFMTPGVSYGAAALFGLLALRRGGQAWRVIRYQRHMRALPRYRLKAAKIPWSPTKLFLGRGFQWTQKHTQRLRDAQRPEAEPYLEPGALKRWARRNEPSWERSPSWRWLYRLTTWDSPLNPLRPPPPVGGKPVLHAVEPDEEQIWMPLEERNGHTLVLGTTRVGKTRMAEILITQDIRRGDVVIVIDPKGDADLMRRCHAECKRSGRLDDFYVFHLGYPRLSARYNPVGEFSRITEVASRMVGPLPDQGNSAAFREFAWRFANIVARALHELGRKPDYTLIARYVTHIEPLLVEYYHWWLDRDGPEDWRSGVRAIEGNDGFFKSLPMALRGRDRHALALVAYAKENGFYDPVADGLRGAFEYEKAYYDKLTSNLLPLIEKLTSGEIGGLLAPDYEDPDDDRPIIDWYKIIREGGVVYVGLDALSDAEVASAVGNSMFADLTSIAGRLYKHGLEHGLPDVAPGEKRRICLHADEFNELIGDEFIPMVNKAGGAGFQVTAYTQTWSDVEARVGSRAKAGQVAGNFNTLVMLRVKEYATAEMLTNQLPTVEVNTLTQVSGVNDSSSPGSGVDFTSRNEDRLTTSEVPMLSVNDVMSLPKGQAFALVEGARLYKLRMPLPDTSTDPSLPADLDAMASEMAERYRTSEHWFDDRATTTPVPPATGAMA